MIENINWYPGHMKKTRELIEQNLKLIDCVIEVIDARIPLSSRNPIIDKLVQSKTKIVLLNKIDLADSNQTKRWVNHFTSKGHYSIAVDSATGTIKKLMELLEEIQEEKNSQRDKKKKLRIMVVGVPNVGKSTLINRLTGKKSTRTGNKPGVTRGKQWLTLTNGMQLLDTPGILWHKFEDNQLGLNLAFCGSIRDEILPLDELALALLNQVKGDYLDAIINRYSLDIEYMKKSMEDKQFELDIELDDLTFNDVEAIDLMEAIAKKRGCIMSGGRIDYERVSKIIIDEFRSGKLERITLETV